MTPMLPIHGAHAHIGVVTRDFDEGLATISAALGLAWTDRNRHEALKLDTPDGVVEWGPLTTALTMGGPMRVELLHGSAESLWATTEAAQLHHVAYWVPDIEAAIAGLQTEGWSVELTPWSPVPAAPRFAYLAKPGEARVELMDMSLRESMLARVGWALDPTRDAPSIRPTTDEMAEERST
jgi:catechol 2,3-dioxygenase-like lactoylglutathione lyase family enzyme